MNRIPAAAPALAAAWLLCAPVAAQPRIESISTDLNLDQCLVMETDDFATSWACPGYKGFPLYIAERNLRFFVSYGFGAPDEIAAGQTPPVVNTLGPRIEWRMTNRSGAWLPFATIVRYRMASDDAARPAEVLVVTRLAPGGTCHIAYVDATANTDAIDLARAAADRLAADFDCSGDAPELSTTFTAWEPEQP